MWESSKNKYAFSSKNVRDLQKHGLLDDGDGGGLQLATRSRAGFGCSFLNVHFQNESWVTENCMLGQSDCHAHGRV